MKKYSKEIAIGVILVLFFMSLIAGLMQYESNPLINYILVTAIIIIGLTTFITKIIKKRSDIASGAPEEDEFTKFAKLNASSKTFFLSMSFWFFLYLFYSAVGGEYEQLGIGILGSALIYGICLWYYRSTGKFDEK